MVKFDSPEIFIGFYIERYKTVVSWIIIISRKKVLENDGNVDFQ
jgi:hypothetical protein